LPFYLDGSYSIESQKQALNVSNLGGKKQMQIEYKKLLMPAALLTGVTLGVNYLLNLVGHPQAPLYSAIQPVSPITGTAGSQVVGWLGGIIPFDSLFGMGTLYLFITAYLTLLAGGFLVSQFNLPVMKSKAGKIGSVILYGTIPLFLIMKFISGGIYLPNLNVFIGLAIYVAISAYVTAILSDKFNVDIGN
jgi:hypothetical protein